MCENIFFLILSDVRVKGEKRSYLNNFTYQKNHQPKLITSKIIKMGGVLDLALSAYSSSSVGLAPAQGQRSGKTRRCGAGWWPALQCASAGSTSPRAAWQAELQQELKDRRAECWMLCGSRNQQRAALRKIWPCVVGSEGTGRVLPYHHVHCLEETRVLTSYFLAGISE